MGATYWRAPRFFSSLEPTSAQAGASHHLELRHGPYRVRLASSERDRTAVCRLRFLVFNLELNEGLDNSRAVGLDMDEFDSACDHLIVEFGREVVGTYRLQTGVVAAANRGYYSEREFDLSPYLRLRSLVIELGRACVHRDHRSTDVLYLLWRGIAQYAIRHDARYLIGCSSLSTQDPAPASATYELLQDYLVEPRLRTVPRTACAISLEPAADSQVKIPKLLRSYLALGARICGPPAIDRDFKTIDFLTLLDLEELSPRLQARFLRR